MIELIDNFKNRKAIKDHRCDYCGGKIEKGSLYNYSKIACDGDIYAWKAHHKCLKVVSDYDLMSYGEDGGLTQGQFCDAVFEEYNYSFGKYPENVTTEQIVDALNAHGEEK